MVSAERLLGCSFHSAADGWKANHEFGQVVEYSLELREALVTIGCTGFAGCQCVKANAFADEVHTLRRL